MRFSDATLSTRTSPSAIVVWRYSDGKAGHDNQSIALLDALAERVATNPYDVTLSGGALRSAFSLPSAPYSNTHPQLLLGAGHATHLALLVAARRFSARSVVMMTPSLPLSWFDLVIVPEHDKVAQRKNTLRTRGPLNRMRPAAKKDPHAGLILLGGPSAHHEWPHTRVVAQIRVILASAPQVRWTLATSRRTPAATVQQLSEELKHASVKLVTHDSVSPDWLALTMPTMGEVWVTQDSVSMLYEALTAGAATGVIELPAKGITRVTRGVNKLFDEGVVLKSSHLAPDHRPKVATIVLAEAQRCAEVIVERWFSNASKAAR